MSPYGQPPDYGAPPPLTVKVGVPFLLQALLGFFGTLAYGFVWLVVMVAVINMNPSQVLFSLVLLGGPGIGLAATLFLTYHLRWYGFLAGVALALLTPLLLFGACMALVVGVSVFNAAGY